MNILITGCAGFIGFHLANHLKKKKFLKIFGVDNLNSYYDVKLKKERLKILQKRSQNNNFFFEKFSIENKLKLEKLIKKQKIDIIVNLAAQAGVRFSIINPKSYFNSNIVGFYNILDLSRKYKIKHLIFASSSSVYGDSKKFPLKENTKINPLQFYAATKASNELMASAFSKIYNMKITCFRFFTVYGPWGRPDMAVYSFTKKILSNKPIEIYNRGKHSRDFTYIDDITLILSKIINSKKILNFKNNFNVFNLGSGKSTKLAKFINILETNLKKRAKINKISRQKGDSKKTHANIMLANKYLGYKPKTNIDVGIKKFVKWYIEFYKKKFNYLKI